MKLIVTGSIAFDYLMSFPGKFTEHILPEHLQRVSLSFLVDSMDKRRGGCAPNIAYTLALLGERPYLMATAGQDFKDYGDWLHAAGVDISLVHHVPDKFTASFFCSTDTENNQIASFYIGAMANASELSMRTVENPGLVIIAPNDPGPQCARLSGDELRDGITGARLVISNDYEFELIRQKTGMGEDGVLEQAAALLITRGEDGCSLYERAAGSGQRAGTPVSRADIKALTPHRIIDPTGVGDAFRGGLMKGMALGKSFKESAQMGTVAATYALEHLGGQSHAYTMKEFSDRYAEHFGSLSL